MATSGENIGSRNTFIPSIPSTGWGALTNRLLRSFANLNVTKFSVLPWVPHGTYLGGFNPTSPGTVAGLPTDPDGETYDSTGIKTNRIFSGVRRLPVLGGANSSFFTSSLSGAPLGKQYLYDPTRAKNTYITSGTKDPIDGLFSLIDTSVFGDATVFKKDEDYVVFDMSRTYVVAFNPEFQFIPYARGHMPFLEVCEVVADDSSTDRDIKNLYPTGTTGGAGIVTDFAVVDDGFVGTTIRETVKSGELFCAKYYYIMNRTSSDDISSSSSVPKTNQVFVQPGVAHVMYIEFGDNDQARYTSDIDDLASA